MKNSKLKQMHSLKQKIVRRRGIGVGEKNDEKGFQLNHQKKFTNTKFDDYFLVNLSEESGKEIGTNRNRDWDTTLGIETEGGEGEGTNLLL
jgi:hypothetical protein